MGSPGSGGRYGSSIGGSRHLKYPVGVGSYRRDDDEMVPREVIRSSLPGFTLILVVLYLVPTGLKIATGDDPGIGWGEIIALVIGGAAIWFALAFRQRSS